VEKIKSIDEPASIGTLNVPVVFVTIAAHDGFFRLLNHWFP
jgi:hypothetical protein